MIDPGPLLLPYRKPTDAAQQKPRVGIVLGGPQPPAWTATLLAWLRSVRWLDVRPYLLSKESHPAAPSWLAERLYARCRKKFDPFRAVDLAEGDRASGLPGDGGETESLSFPARHMLEAEGLDLLVWLPETARPAGSCDGLARYGALSVQLGEPSVEPPYWSEVLRGESVSTATLWWHESSFERSRRLRLAELSTVRSVTFIQNAKESLTAVCRMIAGTAAELAADPQAWLARGRQIPEQAMPPAARRAYPSNVATARFLARQAVRSANVRMEERGRTMRWFTALRRQPALHYANLGRFSAEGLEEILIPAGSQMADPFVVEADGATWLFFEEVPAGSDKGRLSCMEIGAGAGNSSKPFVVMERNHHLSYPCVVRHGGDFFLIPESARGRSVQLFRATRFPVEWRMAPTLLEGLAATDTTPYFDGERWYFFTTTTQPFLETFLFVSERLDGPWRLHPASAISSSVRSCRSAGHLFRQGGRLLRPVQDCSVRYGYAMTVNEVTRLTQTEFEERGVDRILPNWSRGLLATHTLNSAGGIEVVDGLRYQ